MDVFPARSHATAAWLGDAVRGGGGVHRAPYGALTEEALGAFVARVEDAT